MRRIVPVLVLASVVGGCTSVRMVQRDGCWIRQTKKFLDRTIEEIGPCAPPSIQWSDDRLTRVVQECIARTEHHWQTRAILAWGRGEPLPERASEATVLQECTTEASRALTSDNERLKQENELLSSRLRDVGGERDALKARADDASAKLLASHEKLSERLLADREKLGEELAGAQGKMAEYLGEAAKKASQPAVATASATSSSDGAVSTDSTNSAVPASAVASAVPIPAADAPRSVKRQGRTPTRTVAKRPAVCPPGGITATPGVTDASKEKPPQPK